MTKFDAQAKERQLVAEARAWDTSSPIDAMPGDIPIVDVSDYFETGSTRALNAAAAELRFASEKVGFYYLVGHQVEPTLREKIFDETRRFHDQNLQTKESILFNGPQGGLAGAGYLPFGNRMLPRRETGNSNEAFIIKGDATICLDDNQWLQEWQLPGFRDVVESYLKAVQGLALRLLPIYAVALDLEPDFFSAAFTQPFWRLRLTHYPASEELDVVDRAGTSSFGIAPHVDTTFFTLLAQDAPGLTIYSAQHDAWINAPIVPESFVVNSGELLKQWSNDRFLSTRHFANNPSTEQSRLSIPLFFNANADYPMVCLPSCTDADNPPRYKPISYLESQAGVQGE